MSHDENTFLWTSAPYFHHHLQKGDEFIDNARSASFVAKAPIPYTADVDFYRKTSM